jgi:signal transduction histidine kinase
LEKAGPDNAQPPAVRLHIHGDGDSITVHVEDSGKGIPADQADQVFLPFYTTKATGTGVGLSLARQIVQGHGSTLSLLPPAPGNADRLGGACFVFDLRAI